MHADRRDDSCQRFTRSKGKVEWVDGQRKKSTVGAQKTRRVYESKLKPLCWRPETENSWLRHVVKSYREQRFAFAK